MVFLLTIQQILLVIQHIFRSITSPNHLYNEHTSHSPSCLMCLVMTDLLYIWPFLLAELHHMLTVQPHLSLYNISKPALLSDPSAFCTT